MAADRDVSTERWPIIFVSHGAPTLPLEPGRTRDFLLKLGPALGRPRAILVVSAHWETARPTVSASDRPQTIHDFYGFPDELYQLSYPAPGAPPLAAEAARLLQARGVTVDIDPERGLDHGA